MADRSAVTQLAGPVIVDASVAVEYLVAFSMTRQAQALFRTSVDGDVELWAPDLLYPESVSALRRLVRVRAVRLEAAATAVRDLVQLPLTIAGTSGLAEHAWQLRDMMTPYDACYVALAHALDGPVVTADRRLARAAAASGGRAVFLGDLA
jgi:predicted nucleic acid-binding protein